MTNLHNHVWRIGIDPKPKRTKEELLSLIRECGNRGYWLKDNEFFFSKELKQDGLISLCCDGEAAIII